MVALGTTIITPMRFKGAFEWERSRIGLDSFKKWGWGKEHGRRTICRHVWRQCSISALPLKIMAIGSTTLVKLPGWRGTSWRQRQSLRMTRFGLQLNVRAEMLRSRGGGSEVSPPWERWMLPWWVPKKLKKRKRRLKFEGWWSWLRRKCRLSSTRTLRLQQMRSEFWDAWERWWRNRGRMKRFCRPRSSLPRGFFETGVSGNLPSEARWNLWRWRSQLWSLWQRQKLRSWSFKRRKRERSWKSCPPRWCLRSSQVGSWRAGGLSVGIMKRKRRGKRPTPQAQTRPLCVFWFGRQQRWVGVDACLMCAQRFWMLKWSSRLRRICCWFRLHMFWERPSFSKERHFFCRWGRLTGSEDLQDCGDYTVTEPWETWRFRLCWMAEKRCWSWNRWSRSRIFGRWLFWERAFKKIWRMSLSPMAGWLDWSWRMWMTSWSPAGGRSWSQWHSSSNRPGAHQFQKRSEKSQSDSWALRSPVVWQRGRRECIGVWINRLTSEIFLEGMRMERRWERFPSQGIKLPWVRTWPHRHQKGSSHVRRSLESCSG